MLNPHELNEDTRAEDKSWVGVWVWAIGVWLAFFVLLLLPLYLMSPAGPLPWDEEASSVSNSPRP